MERILTIKDLSTFLKCSISTIRGLVRHGEIPYFRIGTKLYFRYSQIESWIDTNEGK